MEQIDVDAKGYKKILLRSLTKVSAQAETLGNRLVRETYNVSRSEVDKAITVRPASVTDPTVFINVHGKMLPLIMFSPSQKVGRRSGVIVKIKRGGRTVSKAMFIAQMKSGHIGIFTRMEEKFMKTNPNRQAIRENYTISVANMFGSRPIIEALERLLTDKFPAILENQLQFYLSSGS